MGLTRITAAPAVLAAVSVLALAGPASANAGTSVPGVPHSSPSASLRLRAMPAGTVAFGKDGKGQLTAQLAMLGLTPGSSHSVELVNPGHSAPVVFSPLTAASTGQANATLTSTFTGDVRQGSRLLIHLGQGGARMARETIAETGPLAAHGSGTNRLTAVEDQGGVSWGTPRGQVTLSYSAASQTLTVIIEASGLSPGHHAAHIHVGSCRSQGPVKYTLTDLIADQHGVVGRTVQVFRNVAAVPARGWYLNIHQGNSTNIVSNGQPAIRFRPLLCANISGLRVPRAR